MFFGATIVEPERLLVKVAKQMKRFHTHVGSAKAAFQQRPEILHAVSVYAAIHVLNGVVNDLVLVLACQTLVAAKFIGVQRNSRFNVSPDEWLKSFLLAVCDDLSANLAAALQDSHDHELVIGVASLSSDAASLDVLVHVPRFPADESFVRFDFPTLATKFRAKGFVLHGQPNPVQHEPSRLLSDAHVLGDLATADAVLAIQDHPHGCEPLVQGDGGIFHHGSDFDGKLALG